MSVYWSHRGSVDFIECRLDFVLGGFDKVDSGIGLDETLSDICTSVHVSVRGSLSVYLLGVNVSGRKERKKEKRQDARGKEWKKERKRGRKKEGKKEREELRKKERKRKEGKKGKRKEEERRKERKG